MDTSKRDELDILIQRALADQVCEAAPPDRVWANIRLEVQERQRPNARTEHLRRVGAEVRAAGSDIVAAARIILTPSTYGGEEGWTDRLILGGHSSAALHYSIHH